MIFEVFPELTIGDKGCRFEVGQRPGGGGVFGETTEEDNTFQTIFGNVRNVKSTICPRLFFLFIEDCGYLKGGGSCLGL